jgi:hypothetical protein
VFYCWQGNNKVECFIAGKHQQPMPCLNFGSSRRNDSDKSKTECHVSDNLVMLSLSIITDKNKAAATCKHLQPDIQFHAIGFSS